MAVWRIWRRIMPLARQRAAVRGWRRNMSLVRHTAADLAAQLPLVRQKAADRRSW